MTQQSVGGGQAGGNWHIARAASAAFKKHLSGLILFNLCLFLCLFTRFERFITQFRASNNRFSLWVVRIRQRPAAYWAYARSFWLYKAVAHCNPFMCGNCDKKYVSREHPTTHWVGETCSFYRIMHYRTKTRGAGRTVKTSVLSPCQQFCVMSVNKF